MKKIYVLSLILILGFSMNVSAALLFEDNFDTETLALNYTGFTNWIVTDGSVDLVNTSTYFEPDLPASYGRLVDLDGSTGNAGVLTTKTTFNFEPGIEYTLSFDLGGNNRNGGSETVKASIADGRFIYTRYMAANDSLTRYYGSFMSATFFSGTISFENLSNDNVGALLDNVRLESMTNGGSPVPEPATLLLLSAGLIGLAGYARKKLP